MIKTKDKSIDLWKLQQPIWVNATVSPLKIQQSLHFNVAISTILHLQQVFTLPIGITDLNYIQ